MSACRGCCKILAAIRRCAAQAQRRWTGKPMAPLSILLQRTCVCMLSGLIHSRVHVHKWCAAGFDKCLAYIMKFLMTLLLLLSYVKLNKSDVTLHGGIIIFSLCPNIYRKYYKCLTYKFSIWLTLITMWSITSDIFTVQVQYLKGHGWQIFIKAIRPDLFVFQKDPSLSLSLYKFSLEWVQLRVKI